MSEFGDLERSEHLVAKAQQQMPAFGSSIAKMAEEFEVAQTLWPERTKLSRPT